MSHSKAIQQVTIPGLFNKFIQIQGKFGMGCKVLKVHPEVYDKLTSLVLSILYTVLRVIVLRSRQNHNNPLFSKSYQKIEVQDAFAGTCCLCGLGQLARLSSFIPVRGSQSCGYTEEAGYTKESGPLLEISDFPVHGSCPSHPPCSPSMNVH